MDYKSVVFACHSRTPWLVLFQLVLLLLVGLGCVLGASELAFLKEPSDVIAVRDRPLMLDCEVEGEGPITITWRRNGVPIATGTRVTVLANGTLLIRNFSKRRESNETDAGEYECAAQNRYGMLVSRKARVQLACEMPLDSDLRYIAKHQLSKSLN
uniref:Ig-like domain-containing protein n=1 Tax=Amphilophus citrinellus TaxID=61819 RepID=A0A3Q0R5W8_AMPCI